MVSSGHVSHPTHLKPAKGSQRPKISKRSPDFVKKSVAIVLRYRYGLFFSAFSTMAFGLKAAEMSDSSNNTSRQDVNKPSSYSNPTSGEEIKMGTELLTKVFTVYRQAEFNVDTLATRFYTQ